MKKQVVLISFITMLSPILWGHIIMTKPLSRLNTLPRNTQDGIKDDSFKGLACGEYFSGGVLTLPAVMPNPTTYKPGQTIEVEFDETIDHFGKFVVDFSPVTAQSNADFQAPLLTVNDPTSAGVGRLSPKKHMLTVTLPNVECSSCVLRLRQQMDDQKINNVSQQYFACADIKLVADVALPPVPDPAPAPNPEPSPAPGDDNSLASSQSSKSVDAENQPSFNSCGLIDAGSSGNGGGPKAPFVMLLLLPLILGIGLKTKNKRQSQLA